MQKLPPPASWARQVEELIPPCIKCAPLKNVCCGRVHGGDRRGVVFCRVSAFTNEGTGCARVQDPCMHCVQPTARPCGIPNDGVQEMHCVRAVVWWQYNQTKIGKAAVVAVTSAPHSV